MKKILIFICIIAMILSSCSSLSVDLESTTNSAADDTTESTSLADSTMEEHSTAEESEAVSESESVADTTTEELSCSESSESSVESESVTDNTEETSGSSQETIATEEKTDATTEPDACADEHLDVNNDALCDNCGISVVIVLDIFAINDLHGKLCDSSSQIGVDEMTTYLKNKYASEDHVLILSSGDMWQGSSESNLTRGLIVTEWMNELDFVSMTLGNHEYDWGEEFIKSNAEIAEFPFLAINVYDADTDERVEYCTPSVMVERGGATIGIIGAIGDVYSAISSERTEGVYFKVGSALTALVREEAIRLREAGADFIIYSVHDGYGQTVSGTAQVSNSQISDYYNAVLSEGYVDIVFEGHTHRSYVLLDGEGVYHLQNSGDNGGISYAEAVINFANGESVVREAKFISSSTYSSLEGDPIVDTLMEKYKDQVSEGDRVLGYNIKYRNSDELRRVLAQLYLETGLEAFGDEYDIVLGGAYMKVRSPGYLPRGNVTFGQLQGLFPFENALVLCSVKGSDLLRCFINTSNSNYYISYSSYGDLVKGDIDPNATYYIVTDTYTSTYAPNNLTEIARYSDDVFAQDLLAEYTENGGFAK